MSYLVMIGAFLFGIFLLAVFCYGIVKAEDHETQADRDEGAYHEAMHAIADEAAGIYGAARLNGLTQWQRERLAQLEERRAYLMKYGVQKPQESPAPSGRTARAK